MEDENNIHKKKKSVEEEDFEEFMEEVEGDREMRTDMNLFADEEGIKQSKQPKDKKENERLPAKRQIVKVKKKEEMKKLKETKEKKEEEEKKKQE